MIAFVKEGSRTSFSALKLLDPSTCDEKQSKVKNNYNIVKYLASN